MVICKIYLLFANNLYLKLSYIKITQKVSKKLDYLLLICLKFLMFVLYSLRQIMNITFSSIQELKLNVEYNFNAYV